MSYFAVYDPALGTLIRAGFCSRSLDVKLQAREGEAVIETDQLYNVAKFKIDVSQSPAAVVPIAT